MKTENIAALRDTLEQMETSQLDSMLLEELRKESPNPQLIHLISSILQKRDSEFVPEIDNNIQQAWEEYQRKVQPVHKKPKLMNSTLLKVASLILVLLALTVFLPPKAEAANFFQRFIAWTEEVFSFINPTEETVVEEVYVFRTDNPGLQEIYDQVTALGINTPVVPMWFPEEYELKEYKATEISAKKCIIAVFSNGKSEAVYQLKIYSDNIPSSYYKDGEIITETEKCGITHTILRNQDLLTAVWTRDNIECSISMDCSEDILLQILESIYTMEDG